MSQEPRGDGDTRLALGGATPQTLSQGPVPGALPLLGPALGPSLPRIPGFPAPGLRPSAPTAPCNGSRPRGAEGRKSLAARRKPVGPDGGDAGRAEGTAGNGLVLPWPRRGGGALGHPGVPRCLLGRPEVHARLRADLCSRRWPWPSTRAWSASLSTGLS